MMNSKIIISGCIIVLTMVFTSCGKNIAPSVSGITRGKNYDSAAFDYVYVEAIRQKLMGNGGDALKYFEQCAKMNPESGAVYYQMAQIVFATGDIMNGKKYIKKAVELNPGNLWYMMMLAGTYYQEKKLDSAIYCYERAVKEYPEKDVLLLLAIFMQRTENMIRLMPYLRILIVNMV